MLPSWTHWQVTVWAKEISAFVTPDDFLEYKVMAFGMREVPSMFQRLMNVTFSVLSCCEAYLYDLVVFWLIGWTCGTTVECIFSFKGSWA